MASEVTPYLAHLRKRQQDVDAIWADAQAVSDVIASPGYALISELLEQTHGDAVTRLLFAHAGSSGRVLDQAEYARLLGFLSGLRQFRWAAEAFSEHAARVSREES